MRFDDERVLVEMQNDRFHSANRLKFTADLVGNAVGLEIDNDDGVDAWRGLLGGRVERRERIGRLGRNELRGLAFSLLNGTPKLLHGQLRRRFCSDRNRPPGDIRFDVRYARSGVKLRSHFLGTPSATHFVRGDFVSHDVGSDHGPGSRNAASGERQQHDREAIDASSQKTAHAGTPI